MITISVEKQKSNIIAIEATGHSGYAESGKDIVCAAISTLTQSLINGLIQVVRIKPEYVIDEKAPRLYVALPKGLKQEQMELCQILMKSTYNSLKDVSVGYPEFIKLKEKQND